MNSIDNAFFINGGQKVSALINSKQQRIGDIAKCVTGFYSGNDKEFLKVLSQDVRNGKSYGVIQSHKVATEYLKENALEGIEGERCFVPIVKGGNIKYLKPDMWFMNWSKDAVRYYKSSNKSRFQNSHYYFKYGIGVPMVSSLQVTASLIENKLFDQSIVGIFPSDPQLISFLLAFFNSPTCNKLIRTINPTANNPANYIKKIPFLMPNKNVLKQVNKLVGEILIQIRLNEKYSFQLEKELNDLIENLYGF